LPNSLVRHNDNPLDASAIQHIEQYVSIQAAAISDPLKHPRLSRNASSSAKNTRSPRAADSIAHTFLTLPPEIRGLIIENYLPDNDRVNVSLVNRQLNNEVGARSTAAAWHATRRYRQEVESSRTSTFEFPKVIRENIASHRDGTLGKEFRSIQTTELANHVNTPQLIPHLAWDRLPLAPEASGSSSSIDLTRLLSYLRMPTGTTPPVIGGHQLLSTALNSDVELRPILLQLLAYQCPPAHRAALRTAAVAIPNGAGAYTLGELARSATDPAERTALRTAAVAIPNGAGADTLEELARSATDPAERTALRTAAVAMPNGAGAYTLRELAGSATDPAERTALRTEARTAAVAIPNGAGAYTLRVLNAAN
jgi:hypothetical protein